MKAASFRNEDGTVPFEIVEGIRTKLMKAILAEMNKTKNMGVTKTMEEYPSPWMASA